MLPTAPSLPPKLECVEELANRQYHCKSKDIAYAALQGIDPMPQRPHVVYITGACVSVCALAGEEFVRVRQRMCVILSG